MATAEISPNAAAAEARPERRQPPRTLADASPELRAALHATLRPGQRLPTSAEIAAANTREKPLQPEAVKAIQPFRMERPFPAAPYWEITDYRAHCWLSGNFCDDLLRAVQASDVVDVSGDELLLLYYDLQYLSQWQRDFCAGLRECPPDPEEYLLGRITEDGNRHHWGDLARDIRALKQERKAEARRHAEELAARQEARRLREEARKFGPRRGGRR